LFLEEKKKSKEKNNIDLNTILELKGVSHYLKDINPECLKNRLCCGFLLKKGKKNIMNYRQRWFLLISAKPLVDLFFFEKFIKYLCYFRMIVRMIIF
jgi:hypothetical protein